MQDFGGTENFLRRKVPEFYTKILFKKKVEDFPKIGQLPCLINAAGPQRDCPFGAVLIVEFFYRK